MKIAHVLNVYIASRLCECKATSVFILGTTNTRLSPSCLPERPAVTVICEIELYFVT